MTAKPSRNWRRMQPIYRLMASGCARLDFSEEAAVEAYNAETHGTPVGDRNGYAAGKHFMDVTVAMWLDGIEKSLLFQWELYVEYDPSMWWWLEKVIGPLRNMPPGHVLEDLYDADRDDLVDRLWDTVDKFYINPEELNDAS